MLHCAPSRISLTSGDISSFDRRIAAMRPSRPADPTVHLSIGPAHQVGQSIIPAKQNPGRHRAESEASEVTLCNATPPQAYRDSNINDEKQDLNDRTPSSHPICDNARKHDDSAHARRASDPARHSPLQSSSRRQIDSFFETDESIGDTVQPCATKPPSTDGPADTRIAPPAYPGLPLTKRGNHTLAEIHADSHPTHPHTEPRPFSSQRARRRHGVGHSHHVFEESATFQAAIERHHIALLRGRPAAGLPTEPPPQSQLPVEHSSTTAPILDPDAPVFVPRTRFGTATSSFTDDGLTFGARDAPWPQAGSEQMPLHLRLQSSTEQNAGPPTRRRTQRSPTGRDARNVTRETGNHRFRNEIQHIYGHRRRPSDPSAGINAAGIDLERYPQLRPPPPAALPQHRADRSSHPSRTIFRPAFSRSPPQGIRQAHRTSDPFEGLSLSQRTTQPQRDGANFASNLRSRGGWRPPRTLSTASISTPNLLRPLDLDCRGSRDGESQLRDRSGACAVPVNARPSINSVDGPAGDYRFSGRRSTTGSLDAATEFLRLRSSPLDDLTERLSRLSTSRSHSVGRTGGRSEANQSRVSLLNGNPFRQDSMPDLVSAGELEGEDFEYLGGAIEDDQNSCSSPVDDPVALSLALPPSSSPMPSSSSSLPGTASFNFVRDGGVSAVSPDSSRDGERIGPTAAGPSSPLTPSRRDRAKKGTQDATSASAVYTPKMRIYDDSKPAGTQPKTPAELTRSSRWAKHLSGPIGTHSPTAGSQDARHAQRLGSPPDIPERHSHRNTYPSAHHGPHASSSSSSAIPNDPSRDEAVATTPRAQHRPVESRTLRHPDDAAALRTAQEENELDAQTPGLERDMRTWLSRRSGDGSLDVTPPREGRFERYLS